MSKVSNDYFEKGVFTLSLDFELIWGTADHGGDGFRRQCLTERKIVIDRMLELFEKYEMPATWAILGHLFLDRCEPENGITHPEIIRPNFSWMEKDWFAHDKGGIENDESIHLGKSLVEKIQKCRVKQEIASHSFSHIVFGDPGCSKETAESEIAECVKIADQQGIELRSFVYPRNEVGHVEILKKYGFSNYRGVEPNWYEDRNVSEKVRRIMRLFDVLRAAAPPLVLPEKTAEGVWNIPGSAMFFPMHGFRRRIPMGLRTSRCIKGLKSAAREKKIFHLWFHPTNMSDELETMFAGLEKILIVAYQLKQAGNLKFLTMGQIAEYAESNSN